MVPLPIQRFGAVDHPVVALSPGRGAQGRRRVGAGERLGERERPDIRRSRPCPAATRRAARRAARVDGVEGEPVMDPEEGGDRGVDPAHLQRREPAEQPRERRVPEPLVRAADEVEVPQRRDEVPRELGLSPVLVGDRPHLVLEELAQPEDLLLFVLGQEGLVCVEVTAVRLQGAHAATVCRAARGCGGRMLGFGYPLGSPSRSCSRRPGVPDRVPDRLQGQRSSTTRVGSSSVASPGRPLGSRP